MLLDIEKINLLKNDIKRESSPPKMSTFNKQMLEDKFEGDDAGSSSKSLEDFDNSSSC